MKLQELMVADVIQISPVGSISDAASSMREKSVGCLVVTVEGAVKGIITDRDLLGCIGRGHDPSQCKVSAHMSRPVVVLKPDEEHITAAEIMRKRRVKRLPVAKNGKLLGIVSLSDLAALAQADLERLESSRLFVSALIKTQGAQGVASKPRLAAASGLPKPTNSRTLGGETEVLS
jgi:CBS domain-containing protein